MKLVPDWLLSAMQDGDGHYSISRVMACATVASTIVLPALIWFIQSAWAQKLAEMPGSFIGFMSAASAITLAMFAANKRAE